MTDIRELVVTSAFASSSYNDYKPSNAFDGTNLAWTSEGGKASQYIGAYLDEEHLIDRVEIKMWGSQARILSIVLQGSTDNSTWKTISEIFTISTPGSKEITIESTDFTNKYSMIRIYATSGVWLDTNPQIGFLVTNIDIYGI